MGLAATEVQITRWPVLLEDVTSLVASLWTRAQVACVILLVFKGLGSEKDPGYLYSLTLAEPSPESPRTLLLYICSVSVGGWWEASRYVAWS